MYSLNDKKRRIDSEASSTQEFSPNKKMQRSSTIATSFTPSPYSMFQPVVQPNIGSMSFNDILKPIAQKLKT